MHTTTRNPYGLMATPTPQLTAVQRGPAWTTRYGCPDACVLDHAGDDGMPGWHHTAPIATTARDIDSDDPNPALPFLAARVTVIDEQADAYGRHTEVWLDFGVHTAQLNPARAREVAADMRRFAERLVAVCDLADEIATDDHDGDPEIRARYDAELDARLKAITEASQYGGAR